MHSVLNRLRHGVSSSRFGRWAALMAMADHGEWGGGGVSGGDTIDLTSSDYTKNLRRFH